MEINIMALNKPLKQGGVVVTTSEIIKALDEMREQESLGVTGRFGLEFALGCVETMTSPIKFEPSHIVNNLRVKTDRCFGIKFCKTFPWVKFSQLRQTLVGDLIPLPNAAGVALLQYLSSGRRACASLKAIGNLTSDNELNGIVINAVDLVIDGHGKERRFWIKGWK